MDLNSYQQAALKTALVKEDPLKIMAARTLGLTGEAGEVADVVKKIIRDDNCQVSDEKTKQIKKELGDTLWYLATLADYFGLGLEEIAQANIDKLADRHSRGALGGSGDER